MKKELFTLHPTTKTFKVGSKQDYDKGYVHYWYGMDTKIQMREIELLRGVPKSRYKKLQGQEIPVKVEKETGEITIDYGILNLICYDPMPSNNKESWMNDKEINK